MTLATTATTASMPGEAIMDPSGSIDPIAVMLHVNHSRAPVFVAHDETLLTTLRDRLQLTGTKRGCNQGVCGACTVLIDGFAMRACLSLAANCIDGRIETIEAAADDPIGLALQDAFVAGGAMQCGFCTAGMISAARALLAENPQPAVAEVQAALSGNLCRCTGYKAIIDAVIAASRTMQASHAGVRP